VVVGAEARLLLTGSDWLVGVTGLFSGDWRSDMRDPLGGTMFLARSEQRRQWSFTCGGMMGVGGSTGGPSADAGAPDA